MSEWVYHNKRILAQDDPVVSAQNRGLRYGDGLFESIKVTNNQLQLWHLHIDRLQRGCDVLSIARPDETELIAAFGKLTEAAGIIQHGRLRVIVYRESAGNYSPLEHTSNFILSLSKKSEQNSQPPRMGVCPIPLKMYTPYSAYKTLNSLPYVYAGIYQAKKNWDEIVILNQHGRVCEGLSTNIYWKKNGTVYTPPISEGCIDGIMRRWLMSQEEIVEKICNPDTLFDADEVYISNSLSGKLKVTLVGNEE